MNPYRQAAPVESYRRRRGRWSSRIAAVLLAVIAADLAAFVAHWGTWALGVGGGAIIAFIAIACAGRSRTPYTRLCALQWNRGDRLGATLLFFNVIEPRYSAKRIARNKAALEAAQVGMPKYE